MPKTCYPVPEYDVNGEDPYDSYISDDDAEEFVSQFGFDVPDGYCLHAQINVALAWFRHDSFPPNQRMPIKERRELLQNLKKGCKLVGCSYPKLSHDDYTSLWWKVKQAQIPPPAPEHLEDRKDFFDPFSQDVGLACLVGWVQDLEEACGQLIEELGHMPPGRPRDPIAGVVVELDRIYFECTGQHDRYTLDTGPNGDYSGPFFEFARSCIDRLPIPTDQPLTDHALAGHIHRLPSTQSG